MLLKASMFSYSIKIVLCHVWDLFIWYKVKKALWTSTFLPGFAQFYFLNLWDLLGRSPKTLPIKCWLRLLVKILAEPIHYHIFTSQASRSFKPIYQCKAKLHWSITSTDNIIEIWRYRVSAFQLQKDTRLASVKKRVALKVKIEEDKICQNMLRSLYVTLVYLMKYI